MKIHVAINLKENNLVRYESIEKFRCIFRLDYYVAHFLGDSCIL